MKMSGKVYDILKFMAWLWVPLTTLIVTLLGVWFPQAPWLDAVRDTLIAIEVFLGAIVSKSNYDYNQLSDVEKAEVQEDDR